MSLNIVAAAIFLSWTLIACPNPKKSETEVLVTEQSQTSATDTIIETLAIPESETEEMKPAQTESEVPVKTETPQSEEPPQERERPRPVHPPVVIANPPPIKNKSMNMNISSAIIKGNFLYVDITYGGGCKPHLFELYSSGKAENGIIQVYLTDHVTDDLCKKLIKESLTFEIRALRQADQEDIRIKINNNQPISWE